MDDSSIDNTEYRSVILKMANANDNPSAVFFNLGFEIESVIYDNESRLVFDED